MKRFKLYDIPYYDTFYDYVTAIGRYEDKVAIAQYTRKGELMTHTYRQLSDDAIALARIIRDRGYEGAHIAIVGENSYDWLVAFLGINCAGSVAVNIDTEQPDEAIRSMIVRSDATAAFASEVFLPICQSLQDDGTLSYLVPMATDRGDYNMHTLCREGAAMDTPVGENLTPETLSAIVFTSGTTSQPKLVLLSQHNILVNSTASVRVARGTQDLFTSLPLYHAYGLNIIVLCCFINGARITLNGDLKTMLRDFKLSQAQTLAAVPLIAEAVYKGLWNGVEAAGKAAEVTKLLRINRFLSRFHLSFRRDLLLSIKEKGGFGRLNQCMCGGAHVSKELADTLNLLGIQVLQGYGITECSPLISVNSVESCVSDSVGHVIPGCEVKFVDDEILVRGPNVMQGYYKEPELTAESFDGEWFKTGDLGYMGKNGFLYITGRKKNLIVFKNGKKVSPEKLEELISHIPLVGEVIVSGATSGSSADDVKVAASICPDPAATAGMTSYEILERLQAEIDKLNKELPTYQQIQMINIRETAFERTAAKKIKRNTV